LSSSSARNRKSQRRPADGPDVSAAIDSKTRGPYKPAEDPFGRAVANWMFPGFLSLILISFWLIRGLGYPAGEHSGPRAMFLAINAATLTGFEQNPGASSLNPFGQSILLGLTILGSLFTMIAGSMAVTRIARLSISDRQLIRWAIAAEILAIGIGTPILCGQDRTFFQAMLLSASAFGNSGLYLGALPGESNPLTHLLILPLAVLGGLGLPVLIEISRAIFGKQSLSIHSQRVLRVSAWLYVIGFSLLFLLSLPNLDAWSTQTLSDAAKASSILSIESRTGGMAIYPIYRAGPAVQWIVLVLMAIGASPGGSGGGLKTTTFAEICLGIRKILRGEKIGRSFGVAALWLGIYGGIVLASAMLISHVDPARAFDGALLNAVSGASNVGFSLNQIPDVSRALYAYSAIMLVGRAAPLMVLWWMAETTPDADAAIG
jgi:trk system potassium uptake protein